MFVCLFVGPASQLLSNLLHYHHPPAECSISCSSRQAGQGCRERGRERPAIQLHGLEGEEGAPCIYLFFYIIQNKQDRESLRRVWQCLRQIFLEWQGRGVWRGRAGETVAIIKGGEVTQITQLGRGGDEWSGDFFGGGQYKTTDATKSQQALNNNPISHFVLFFFLWRLMGRNRKIIMNTQQESTRSLIEPRTFPHWSRPGWWNFFFWETCSGKTSHFEMLIADKCSYQHANT